MTCPMLVESGVYLLGALPPAQRQAYERHLATCEECRAEVSDLAVLPGLLGRIDEAALDEVVETDTPATVLPNVIKLVHQRRRRQRTFAIAGAAAAACLALVAGLLLPSSPASHPAAVGTPSASVSGSGSVTPSPSASLVPMVPVGKPIGLSARIAISGDAAGTRITGTCSYAASPWDTGANYSLWVVTKTGKSEHLGSWHALPGTSLPVDGMSWWPMDQVATVQMRAPDGTVVLSYTVT